MIRSSDSIDAAQAEFPAVPQQRRKRAGRSNMATFDALCALETDDHVLWPLTTAAQRGYGQVNINGRKEYTHRAALRRRVPQPSPAERYVCHGPGCPPTCMNYRHLRWGTPTSNNLDRRRDGTAPSGARNPNAKLTEEQVDQIRQLRSAGLFYRVIAERFAVSTMTAYRAATGQSWT